MARRRRVDVMLRVANVPVLLLEHILEEAEMEASCIFWVPTCEIDCYVVKFGTLAGTVNKKEI